VVSFSTVPGPDRQGVQLQHAVRALASRFVVDVLTLRLGELAYVERFHRTRMLRVPVAEDDPLPTRIEAFRRAVKRQLEGAEYDVVHFRDACSGIPVLERRAALGYRTVFEVARSVHGGGIADDATARAELARDEATCAAEADLVLCGSESARRFLTLRLPPARHERVVVVPPGVDIDRFDAEPVEGQGPPVVLYAGAVASGLGVRVLLRAFRDVIDRGPARLVLAGPVARDFREPLRTALEQLALTPHVELPGAIDHEDMARVISRATVCVAPYAPDPGQRPLAGFPTKLLEYMACRRAVVAPRNPAVREALQDGVEGLLFEGPRELATQLTRLLTDEPLRVRLAEAGQRRVRLRFAASGLRRRLLEAYAPLLPAHTWNPVGTQAARTTMALAGAGAGVTLVTADAGAEGSPGADTSLVVVGLSDDADSHATLITGFVQEDTSPAIHVPPGGGAAAGEAWLVIAGDGSITRSTLFGANEAGETGESSSASLPTMIEQRAHVPDAAEPAPSGGRFVAGELEAREAPPSAPSFVAAGEMLSPSVVAQGTTTRDD
jgi:glycosyltransferase involved in cell wall biosynthesis